MPSRTHHVVVTGLWPWMEPTRLLGPGGWVFEGRVAYTDLLTHAAADLAARLHNLVLGGSVIALEVRPPLGRPDIRAARTTDARRRRDTSVGFSRGGVRLDAEGKVSLTPEQLALELGARFSGRTVVDAGCGAGGNSIGFARAGCRVVAVEQNAARLQDAAHNAQIYGVESRIQFVRGDALTVLADTNTPPDLLFVDPPWGVDWARGGMGIAAFPLLHEILKRGLHTRFSAVVLKLPPSFFVAEIDGGRPTAVYGRAPGDSQRVKFILVQLGR